MTPEEYNFWEMVSRILAVPVSGLLLYFVYRLFTLPHDLYVSSQTKTKFVKVKETEEYTMYNEVGNPSNGKFVLKEEFYARNRPKAIDK